MKFRMMTVPCVLLTLAMYLPSVAQPTVVDARATLVAPDDSIRDYSGKAVLTIIIEVQGAVHAPGIYRVASSTKLVQMISYAGGPTADAQLNDVRIVHDLTVDPTITEPVVRYDLAEYQKTGNPVLNPILYPNDTVIIPLAPRNGDPALPSESNNK